MDTKISSLAPGSAVLGTDKFVAVETNGVGPVIKTGAQLKAWATSELPTVVTAKGFGAVGDGVVDDTAAINSAFRYIESVGQPIPFVFGPFTFKIAGSLVLPTTSGNQFQYILGNGCKLVKTGTGIVLGRVPSTQSNAETMIDQCIYHISGVYFLGDLTTGQIGLHLAANYTSVVENCSFQDLDIGSIGTFILGGVWRSLRYTNCKSRPFILQSGYGEGSPIWTGGSLDNAASNCNLVDSCRVFGATTQTASYTIYGSDAVTLRNVISEGNAQLYDIFFDYQSATTVKSFTVDGLHCENPNAKVNLKIKATGVVNIKDLVRTYPAALLDASGSGATSWNFSGLSYLGNMPGTPWFYHTDGGGYGGTAGGNSSGSGYRFSNCFVGIDVSGIFSASNWENGQLAHSIGMVDTRGSDQGFAVKSNGVLSLLSGDSWGMYVETTNLKVYDLDGTRGFVSGKLSTHTNYTAGAPTATGYLTLYDATGTAYKVLVST